MSTLTFSDMNKFIGLVTDIFPGIKTKDIIYDKLTIACKEVLLEQKLDIIDS